MRYVFSILQAFGLAFSGLLVALGLSWLILGQLNFSYSFWHEYDGMAAGIDRLAKTNVNKFGFEKTTKEQRADIFRQIMDSVHDGGEGLEEITFKVPGHPEQVLLVESEVIHLQDVANLVDAGLLLAFVAFVIWASSWGYVIWAKTSPPSIQAQLFSMLLFLVFVAVVVFAVGPLDVFYVLHVWLFPEGNQWFFYFKESLMATLMYAPTFFGWVAIEWFSLALILFFVIQIGAALAVKRVVRY